MMPPAGMRLSGDAFLCARVMNWWETQRSGFVFDSSGGFCLPDGSMLSPDVSYITAVKSRAGSLSVYLP